MCQILNLEITLDAESSTVIYFIFLLQEFWKLCQLVPAFSLLCSLPSYPKFPINKVSEGTSKSKSNHWVGPEQKSWELARCSMTPPRQHNLRLPLMAVFLKPILLYLMLLIPPFLKLPILDFRIFYYSASPATFLPASLNVPSLLWCSPFSLDLWAFSKANPLLSALLPPHLRPRRDFHFHSFNLD